MILDYNTMFEPLGGTTTPATGPSTNTLDLTPIFSGNNFRDVGASKKLWLVIEVNQAFAGGTSVDFQLQTCAQSNFGSGVVTLFDSGAIPTANLTAGAVVVSVSVPEGVLKYLRLNYTVTGSFTAGTINAFLALNVQDSKVYANNYQVA